MKESKVLSNNLLRCLFILALVVSTFIKFRAVTNFNFAFTIDQGRDLVDVRHMVENFSPRLIGPTTSINGVFLGPSYYYLISLPYWFSSGNPASILMWQTIIFQLSVVFLWLVLKKKNETLATISGLLLLLSPVGFYTARYFWNANFMPAFAILYLATLYKVLTEEDDIKWVLILGLVSGVSLQIEAAFGILFFPFAFICLLFKPKLLKTVLYLSLGFVLTLIPQLIFEVRHNFIMTHTLINGLSGQSGILGEKMSFGDKFFQRQEIYKSGIRESSHIPFEYLRLLYAGSIIYIFSFASSKIFNDKRIKIYYFVPVIFLVFSFLFYLGFSQLIKTWYTLSLPVFFIMLLSVFLSLVWEGNGYKRLIAFLILMYMFVCVSNTHLPYLKNTSIPSTDPSNLSNQLSVIDLIYKNANGRAFKVYSYLPSVYDYTYQYLFWWYGKTHFNYMPSDLAYLPNEPEYIEDRISFLSPSKEFKETDMTYLIVEKGENVKHLQEWQGNFAHLCQVRISTPKLPVEVIRAFDCVKTKHYE